MENHKKYTSDERMLTLIEVLKTRQKIKFNFEFCESINFSNTNLGKIKKGTKHFTPEHIEKAIKVFKVNANWIFGVSDNIFFENISSKKLVHKKVHKTV